VRRGATAFVRRPLSVRNSRAPLAGAVVGSVGGRAGARPPHGGLDTPSGENLTRASRGGTLRAVEVVEMDGSTAPRRSDGEPDVSQYCYNCGERGESQKCKLICRNPRCGVHIILACVD
jgi:hypothetical protein